MTDYPINPRYDEFCELNGLDPESLPTTFPFLVDEPEPVISVAAIAPRVEGPTATFVVSTGLIGQPLTVSSTGGQLSLCGGDATLDGGSLTIHGDAGARLCVTGTESGSVAVAVSAFATTTDTLQWFTNTDPDCQVFALFPAIDEVSAAAMSEIVIRSLAKTGSSVDQALASWMLATGALAAVLVGATLAAVFRVRRL